VEEELYSSDDNSSVYSSEDDFEEERGMARRFVKKYPLLNLA